jgi:sugar fermentation stimulation protein A
MLVSFPQPLLKARLVKRYKRFFADGILEGGAEVTAHCPNTGSLKTCGSPGDTIFLLHDPSPTRKLAYTWELTELATGFVGVNTSRPNQVAKAAVLAGKIPELDGYQNIRSEVKYDQDSRIDLLLSEPKQGKSHSLCYVEVKNTTLFEDGAVKFPDAVTARGLKHLKALEAMVKQGHRAVMLYMVNRSEGNFFRVAGEIDPQYEKALIHAVQNGVEVLAYRIRHSLEGLDLGERVSVVLP